MQRLVVEGRATREAAVSGSSVDLGSRPARVPVPRCRRAMQNGGLRDRSKANGPYQALSKCPRSAGARAVATASSDSLRACSLWAQWSNRGSHSANWCQGLCLDGLLALAHAAKGWIGLHGPKARSNPVCFYECATSVEAPHVLSVPAIGAEVIRRSFAINSKGLRILSVRPPLDGRRRRPSAIKGHSDAEPPRGAKAQRAGIEQWPSLSTGPAGDFEGKIGRAAREPERVGRHQGGSLAAPRAVAARLGSGADTFHAGAIRRRLVGPVAGRARRLNKR